MSVSPEPPAPPPGGAALAEHRPRFLGRTDPDWWGADLVPPPAGPDDERRDRTEGPAPHGNERPRETRRAA